MIILQGLVTESILETQSVNLVQFKDNNYLQIKFANVNVYNSLKLDKYDIGKRLFDEVVRKVLTPLNEHVAAPRYSEWVMVWRGVYPTSEVFLHYES